jgi:DNA-binding transcriptional MerR regulator
MEASKFIGTGGLAERLGVSNTRIRQLEREGVIPPAQRLVPGDRRIWPLNDVSAIKARLQEHRAIRKETTAAA